MTGIETSGLQFPKLPSLASEDIKAIRNSWGGKFLGRTAVVLSLVLMLLGSGVAMNKGFDELLNKSLVLTPLQEFAFFYGIPGTYVAVQMYVEWRAARERKTLQKLAVKPVAVPQGYFRVGPYLDTPEDRAKFGRSDNAHEKILAWLKRYTGIPLYLTGDSGAGKSSLLNAFVLPSLRESGWTVVEVRAWQDPDQALIQALNTLPGMPRPRQNEEQVLRSVIEIAARRAKFPLLLVLDQFEEFLILGKPEKHEQFAAFIKSLKSNPVKNLAVLLALRSDYQTLLEDIGLPSLRQGENFHQVGRFTVSAATRFLTRSDLNLQPQALEQLINSSAAMDETPGLVRPITLNIVGHVLAEGSAVAPSMDAGQLTRVYIEQAISQPAISGFAVPVLENLITEQGTKQPRSEQDLAKATQLRAGEVRGVLNALSAQALARPLDPEQGIWELSHDFIARAVARQLGRQKRGFLVRAAAYTAPALLTVALAAVAAWIVVRPLYMMSELDNLGISITRSGDGFIGTATRGCNDASLARAAPLLGEIGVTRLALTDLCNIANLTPIEGLTTLKQLNLSASHVTDLRPLKNLTALTQLDLSRNLLLQDLSPLEGITSLTQLDLSDTYISDFSPLSGLTALTQLDLSTDVNLTDLTPLKGLTALNQLNLFSDNISDLSPLKGLAALTQLNLSYDAFLKDLSPLKGLTSLAQLDLSHDRFITDLSPLNGLTALTTLGLSNTRIRDLSPLENLPRLRISCFPFGPDFQLTLYKVSNGANPCLPHIY